MTCPGCGFDPREDFAFCPKCGRKLPAACPACGFACASEFAFCPKCGAALAAPAAAAPPPPAAAQQPGPMPARTTDHDADRRPVTVLFADLTGFTALSERLDPEDVRAFQNDMFRMMAEEIQRFDGFVEKFVGDAVMSVFGAPVAHEDDPERALRAALAMQERMAVTRRRWGPRAPRRTLGRRRTRTSRRSRTLRMRRAACGRTRDRTRSPIAPRSRSPDTSWP